MQARMVAVEKQKTKEVTSGAVRIQAAYKCGAGRVM